MTSSYDTNDRNLAIYANAAGLLTFTSIPLLNVIVTLLIVLKTQKEPAPLARVHARTSFNFQLTFLFIQVLCVIAAFTAPNLLLSVVVAYVSLLILNAVLCIWGCARASDLKPFRYPLAIPFLR